MMMLDVERKTHELKCWPEFFDAVMDGRKTFEYRKNDRGYRVGDMLHLREWTPTVEQYTGRACIVDVTYLVNEAPGLPDGYCIMQIAVTVPF